MKEEKSKLICDANEAVAIIAHKTNEVCAIYPMLYIYHDDDLASDIKCQPNLNSEIVKKIGNSTKLVFSVVKSLSEGEFSPIDLLDYIYAVLHSPTYR